MTVADSWAEKLEVAIREALAEFRFISEKEQKEQEELRALLIESYEFVDLIVTSRRDCCEAQPLLRKLRDRVERCLRSREQLTLSRVSAVVWVVSIVEQWAMPAESRNCRSSVVSGSSQATEA
jgi:hypothetical protein